jgi:hypothetical protein
MQRQQLAQRIDRQMQLRALLVLGTAISYPARAPLSGDERSVRLSRMGALDCAFRPSACRSTA